MGSIQCRRGLEDLASFGLAVALIPLYAGNYGPYSPNPHNTLFSSALEPCGSLERPRHSRFRCRNHHFKTLALPSIRAHIPGAQPTHLYTLFLTEPLFLTVSLPAKVRLHRHKMRPPAQPRPLRAEANPGPPKLVPALLAVQPREPQQIIENRSLSNTIIASIRLSDSQKLVARH